MILPSEQIYPIESNLSWEVLAATPEIYYTAYGAFINLKIVENDKILVRGVGSATGIEFYSLTKSRFPNAKYTEVLKIYQKEKFTWNRT